jgi:tetratricopeptide (TPR) repeat protein
MRRAVLLAAFVACSAAAFAQTAFAQTAFAQAASAQSASALYESGRTAMLEERYYEAMESFLESLRVNPSYAEPVAALAECFYSLGEFDQALSYVRRARALSRGSSSLANLEAFILIAQGDLAGADALVRETLSREPYNREALFAAAELDVARGKAGEAASRYREAARRYPDDRRALLSLALVLGSLGDAEGARSYASRAASAHPDDHRVRYYAAYLDAAAGRLKDAAAGLSFALTLKPDYAPARSLLASVRYRLGEWEEAARLADEVIAADRANISAWYLKGLSYARLGRSVEARSVLSLALSVDPTDEFVRYSLEDLLVSSTPAESPERAKWAAYHLNRAEEYASRNLSDQALFEYRRALRIDPYSKNGRAAFAELLRALGYPARQLAELRFLQELGKSDRAINDAVETYDSLLADALHRRWNVDVNTLGSRHWKIAVVTISSQSPVRHVDAGKVAASFIRDLLTHDSNIAPVNIPVEQSGFSNAFRSAREAGADYFLVVSAAESERDLSLRGNLYVARTGSAASEFRAFRTGADRVRNSSRKIVELLGAALPFRSQLIARRAGQGLIDKGRSNGVVSGMKLEIVKKGAAIPLAEGIGLSYGPENITGTLTVEDSDEEVAAGALARNGFFDRISEGDEVVLKPEKAAAAAAKGAEPVSADPELRFLLRNLR